MARYRATFDGERRTAKVTVQLAPSERQRLEEAASSLGSPLSEYVRELCLRRQLKMTVVAGTTRNPVAKLLADELRAIGINLNQLAKVANQTGEIRREAELDRTLEELKVAMARAITL
jgi:hypothetical protein